MAVSSKNGSRSCKLTSSRDLEVAKLEEEDERILRDICTANGINYEKLFRSGNVSVKQLDMFFFGCPKIVGLAHFPSLTKLCIMNQKILSLVGVGACPNLEELWVCEGEIEVIEDLEGCHNLTHLLLYTNKICRIEGINHLKRLQRLWLNGNRLTTIEGIDSLYEIKDLNLAGNNIAKIGQSLSHLHKLEHLDLSGNPIMSLQELSFIYHLSTLISLSLCHPFYPASPVCQGCNYSSILLYHMPHLQRLDNRDVSSPDLHSLVKGLVNKKKQYYRVKLHHQKELGVMEKEVISHYLSECRNNVYVKLRGLHRKIKKLQILSSSSSIDIEKEEELRCKMDMLKSHCHHLEQYLLSVEEKCRFEVERLKEKEDDVIQRWEAELETGGNVRFIDGNPKHSWFNSCVELVTSRFLASDFEPLGVGGIKVHSVVRVENRLLISQFNMIVKKLLEEDEEEDVKECVYRDRLEYLFLVCKSPLQLNSVCMNGFSTVGETNGLYIPLTNSICHAEHHKFISSSSCSFPLQGQLLLCKVYVGHTVELKDVITRPSQMDTCGYQMLKEGGRGGVPQGEWRVFNKFLVLPEYLINVEYIPMEKTEMKEKDVIPAFVDEDIVSSPSSRPKLTMLDETVLLHFTGEQSLLHITTLDLSSNRITRFRLGPSLPFLTSLFLSCNELTTAEGLAHMPQLEKLDLSFNNLNSLDGIKSLPKLSVLDIGWNNLHHSRADLFILQRHAPLLKVLNTNYNPWDKFKTFRRYALGTLRTLRSLDDVEVTENEMSESIHYIVSTHLSLTSLLPHARTDSDLTPTLKLLPVAQHVVRHSCHRPAQLFCNGDWPSQVTAVDLSGLHLHKLTNMDQLRNLRWLCIADNNLTSIEGIESCHKLEELTADNNMLQSFPSLHHHPLLSWVSLANNKISSVSLPTSPLKHVIHFNISGNPITSFDGLEKFPSLVELFASRTVLEDHRKLLILKTLNNLMVLELSFTPLSSLVSYRHFTIYHLSSLRMLDGQPVDSNEIALSKEKFGGRLTQDVIYEQFPLEKFSALRSIDFPQSGFKSVDLSPVSAFDNLASLNLEHNSLTSFSGLIHLNKLKVLCLNHNRVDSLQHQRHGDVLSVHPPPSVLLSLQVLHLAYNGISNLSALQLWRLPSLCALFLQGNEISRVEGLDGLVRLTELVLDRNKVKSLLPDSLTSLPHLRELHLEENRLFDLSYFCHKNLERLYLGMNRIQEYSDLDKLCCLPSLIELSLISNPVSRHMQHRSFLIYRLSSLQSLDGVLVTTEERQNAEITFGEHFVDDEMHMVSERTLPSLPSNKNTFHLPSSKAAVEPQSVYLHTLNVVHNLRREKE